MTTLGHQMKQFCKKDLFSFCPKWQPNINFRTLLPVSLGMKSSDGPVIVVHSSLTDEWHFTTLGFFAPILDEWTMTCCSPKISMLLSASCTFTVIDLLHVPLSGCFEEIGKEQEIN